MSEELPFDLPSGIQSTIDFSEISKEEQQILIRLEIRTGRKGRRFVTIIEGIDEKDFDLEQMAKTLKKRCATGGTVKNGRIELQGDQRTKAKKILIEEFGFKDEQIRVL